MIGLTDINEYLYHTDTDSFTRLILRCTECLELQSFELDIHYQPTNHTSTFLIS